MCVAQAKENTSDFLSWQCEFAATEMSNIDTNARHVAAAQNEHKDAALSCVPPKAHLSPSAYCSVVISHLLQNLLALSPNPWTPPHLVISRNTEHLFWLVVRAGGHVIGVEVLRDRKLEVGARRDGFFLLGWGPCWEARVVSGWRGDPKRVCDVPTSQEHASLKATP
jgi:hypothetical protein